MNFGISYHHSVCVKQIKEHNYQAVALRVNKNTDNSLSALGEPNFCLTRAKW